MEGRQRRAALKALAAQTPLLRKLPDYTVVEQTPMDWSGYKRMEYRVSVPAETSRQACHAIATKISKSAVKEGIDVVAIFIYIGGTETDGPHWYMSAEFGPGGKWENVGKDLPCFVSLEWN